MRTAWRRTCNSRTRAFLSPGVLIRSESLRRFSTGTREHSNLRDWWHTTRKKSWFVCRTYLPLSTRLIIERPLDELLREPAERRLLRPLPTDVPALLRPLPTDAPWREGTSVNPRSTRRATGRAPRRLAVYRMCGHGESTVIGLRIVCSRDDVLNVQRPRW